MNQCNSSRSGRCGTTLLESVFAIALLAAVLPLLMMGMGASLRDERQSRAEQQATWLLPVGFPHRENFIENGGLRAGCWAHADDGSRLAAVGREAGRRGVKAVRGERVACLVFVECQGPADTVHAGPMERWRIRVEYPASLPRERRQTLEWLTHVRP